MCTVTRRSLGALGRHRGAANSVVSRANLSQVPVMTLDKLSLVKCPWFDVARDLYRGPSKASAQMNEAGCTSLRKQRR